MPTAAPEPSGVYRCFIVCLVVTFTLLPSGTEAFGFVHTPSGIGDIYEPNQKINNNNDHHKNETRKNGTIVCHIVSDGVECDGQLYTVPDAQDSPPSTQFFEDLGVSIGLTLIAGKDTIQDPI